MSEMRISGPGMAHEAAYTSAYMAWLGEEPAFTTKTSKFVDTIDYIWLSQTALEHLGGVLAGIPVEDKEEFLAGYATTQPGLASTEEALATVVGAAAFPAAMPDEAHFPSDHMAIGCVLKM